LGKKVVDVLPNFLRFLDSTRACAGLVVGRAKSIGKLRAHFSKFIVLFEGHILSSWPGVMCSPFKPWDLGQTGAGPNLATKVLKQGYLFISWDWRNYVQAVQ
jgi:hypothetical protein